MRFSGVIYTSWDAEAAPEAAKLIKVLIYHNKIQGISLQVQNLMMHKNYRMAWIYLH